MSSTPIKKKIQKIDSYDFEYFISDLWERQGWSTEVEQQSRDAGVDIRATKSRPYSQKVIIQAKRYGENTKVGGPEVQQYASIRQQEKNVDTVIIVTSSGFTRSAKERGDDLNVKLINGNKIVSIINKLDAFDILDNYTHNNQTSKKGEDNHTHNTQEMGKSSKNIRSNWLFGEDGRVSSRPAVVGDRIYFGTYKNTVYSLDIKTASKEWTFRTKDHVQGSPVVSNNTVYIGSTDYNWYAINSKNGDLRWKFKSNQPNTYSLAVGDKKVYIPVKKESGNRALYSLDKKTGSKEWEFETGGIFVNSRTIDRPAISNGIVYAGAKNNYLYALDANTGSKEWTYRTDDIIRPTPVISNGLVYVGDSDGVFYALDAKSGSKEWQFDSGGRISASAIVDSENVYFTSEEDVYALHSEDGSKKWSYKMEGKTFYPPMMRAGKIIIGSNDGSLYALDSSTGSEQWKNNICDRIMTPLTISQDNIYFGSTDGVYNLKIN